MVGQLGTGQMSGGVYAEPVYTDAGTLYLRLRSDCRVGEMYHRIHPCEKRSLDQ